MSTDHLNAHPSALDADTTSENLNDLECELDPNFRDYLRKPNTGDDTLDSGIAGPDVPDLDPEFSRPSQGLDSEDDPAFSQMPLPDDFTVDDLTEVTKAEFARWELLAQFPYLISQAIKAALDHGLDKNPDLRYQLLHDAKVYLVKALEYYNQDERPYLFTEKGFIKGTQVAALTACPQVKQASIKAAAIRLAFARSNFYVSALLAPHCDDHFERGGSLGLSRNNLSAMLKAVEGGLNDLLTFYKKQKISSTT